MKRIFLIFTAVALMALVYYLFVRSFEFAVNFQAKTAPGDVISTIRIWTRSLDKAQIVSVDSFNSVIQTIDINQRQYRFHWKFDVVNDSVTSVNVQVSEPANAIRNKLMIPFSEQPIEKDAADIVRQFYDVLKTHIEITSVSIIGLSEVTPSFCVCQAHEGKQIEKANGMMQHFVPLTEFITKYGISVNGQPMVLVREWNHNEGLVKFDFCFPIAPSITLPPPSTFQYKQFGKIRALKAEYRGNYITSDRAWYELMTYARENGYKVKGLPIELFYDNPNLGINEQAWKADIYLPVD